MSGLDSDCSPHFSCASTASPYDDCGKLLYLNANDSVLAEK